MSSSKRTNVPPKEWAKHLRPFGKKEFWSSVRNIFRSEDRIETLRELEKEVDEKIDKILETLIPPVDTAEASSRRIMNFVRGVTDIDGNLLEEKGIPVKDQYGNVLFHTDMTMPAPEGQQIRPLEDDSAKQLINSIKSRYSKIELTDAPLAEKPKPSKVVTINISGMVGTGKTYILAKIEEMLINELDAVVTSEALDVEENMYGKRKGDIGDYHLAKLREGEIQFNLTETHLRDDGKPFGSPLEESKPISFSHRCPCDDH